MEFPGFVGPAYTARSSSADRERCVNLYTEVDPTGKAGKILYGTPGLALLGSVGTGPDRGRLQCGDSILVVSGAGIYRMLSDYSSVLLYMMLTSTGPVCISQGGTAALITDGSAGYSVDLDAWTAEPVTSPGFPANPGSNCFCQGYFITHSIGSSVWWISQPFDPTTWNALDYASKETENDPIQRVITDDKELQLIGAKTTEVWQNVGSNDFPFTIIPGATLKTGTPAALSCQELDGAIIFLGQSKDGYGVIWSLVGFSANRISTSAIESEIAKYPVITDAFAWTYQAEGHSFYVLVFPTAQKTWVCDTTQNNDWHERLYRNPLTGLNEQVLPVSHALYNNTHVVGDRRNGNIYSLDLNTYSDNGDPLIALRSSPHIFKGGIRAFIALLEFFFEPGIGLQSGIGSDPQCMLRISKDGGKTWGKQRTRSIGKQGQYKRRSMFTRNGSGRDMIIELSISDPIKRVIIGANIEVS